MSSPSDVSRVSQKARPGSAAQLSSEIVAPVNIEELAEAFKRFEDFKRRLLNENDSVEIAGKRFLKKSAWRKWELACGVSDEVVSFERVPPEGNDKNGNFYYRVVARAFHTASGRSSVGVAIVARNEKKNWAHEEHDILALCHTRAKNRAIADLVGGGEVSAEEIVSEVSDGKEVASPDRPSVPQVEMFAWHVPTTNEVPHNIRQEPIFHKAQAIGIVNIDEEHSEFAFIPERRLTAQAPPITNFLKSRILDATKGKHPDFDYAIDVVDGSLRAVLVRGHLDPDRLKELLDAVGWAFSKAAESKKAMETGA